MSEAKRLSDCITRLAPHLDLNGVAITGGVAMQLGMAALGLERPRHPIADLDLVARSTGDVMPSVVEQFLVSHYHAAGPGVPKFMIQLVDPLTRLRIDVFPDLVGSLADAEPMAIGGQLVPVLPLKRIFEHKVQTLTRASASAPVDPKHVHDAQFLAEVLALKVPDVAHDAMAPDIYGIDDWLCARCELSLHPSWPLAAKDRVFELLGWKRGSV